MSDDIAWMNAAELMAAYRAKTLSPVEVARTLLSRIDALDMHFNSFCLIDADETLAQAKASESRWNRGEPQGLLDGVPVGIKDLIITKGWPTMRGSETVDPAQAWNEDAPSVARLKEHGAVLIGKTTTPEFGWKGTTDSGLMGTTRNPWNNEKTPGGSSGGSSAALAAGFCPLAIGTDGGGSIRIPTGFTGTFGLKPSFGRVPAFPISPFGTVTHVGPMSRDVEGSALFLSVITEPDARDWYAMAADGRNYTDGLRDGIKGARIAFSPRLGYVQNIDPEVEVLVAQAAKRFEDLGAHVEQVDPGFADPSDTFRTLWWSGAYSALGSLPPELLALVEAPLQDVVREGAKFSLREYQLAVKAREALGSHMRQFMETFDFVLTPTLATAAFDVDIIAPKGFEGDQWMGWTPFSYPFNLTQQPAASINCGLTKAGLPVGLQIVGRMHDDAGVLRAAKAFEAIEPMAQARADLSVYE